MSIARDIEDPVTTRTDAGLARLLVRAACGEVRAFMAFYDATCALVWRLETARHGDPERATDAAYERYYAAWLRAGSHRTSGLSPRAWLLSLQPVPDPPCALRAATRERG